MTVRAVEGKKPYTGGTAIEIDENKVINLRLRDENNLIIYDAGDNEIYVDLQLPDELTPTDAFPVGITTGRVIVDNGWDLQGTLICAKTTSGDNIKVLYADEGTLWIDNGTGTFKQIYFKADVDQIITTLTTYINGELAKKQNGVTSATAPTDPAEGDLWYDTTSNTLKVYNGSSWVATGGGGGSGDVVVSTDTGNELSTGVALWFGTESDYSSISTPDTNTLYIQYVDDAPPTPTFVTCDFTQGDQGFVIDESWSSTSGRDSNGFYIQSEWNRGSGMSITVPSSIINQGTPKQIKLYGKNMNLGSGVGVSEGVDTKTVRVFGSQITCTPYSGTGAWGTPNNTNVSPLNEDVFVIDFENEVCYLESATSTTATIYSSTILQLWTNGTLNLCLLSPNNSTYGYLQKAEFYF